MTRPSPTLVSAVRTLRAPSCWFALSLALAACGGDDTADPGGPGDGSSGKNGGKSGSAGASGKGGSSSGGSSGTGAGGTSSGGTSSGGTSAGSSGACPAGQQLCGTTCVDLQSDAAHCGTCERDCSKPGAQFACEVGQCVFKACQPGFGDCNGKPNDGCEVDLKGGTTCPCAPGETQPCYTGADGTEGVGPCHSGEHVCKDDGTGWGACTGQVTPSLDSCADDLDQDCNGTPFTCAGANEICGVNGTCSDPCAPEELGTSYIGCVYYPTVTPNIVHSNFHFAVAVSNTNDVPVTVAVTRADASVAQETVDPKSVKVINLPWVASLKGPDGPGPSVALAPMPGSVLEPAGAYKLSASRPVTVYQYNALEYLLSGGYSYTNDASLLLPVNTWRNEYMVAARHHFMTTSGFYTVVASENGTTVTVQKGVKTLSLKAGVPGVGTDGNGTFTLNAGDVATLVTSGSQQDDPSDATGTLIKSDKPVQVFGGHQCTFIPAGVAACDHLEEAMFPVDTLSNEYIVMAPLAPNGGGPKANLVRLIATDPDTTFTYDPPQGNGPTAIAQAGDWVEFSTDQSFRISATKRFLLAQYALGQQAGGGGGDPDITLGVPTAQYRKDYLFHAPTSYAQNYVNITAPTSASIVLDGAPVTGFTPLGASGYNVVRVSLPSTNGGNHTITGDLAFGISVYGYGDYTSYWYPGGLDLRVIKD